MPEFHARISPSSFARVRQCPASLLFAEKFPNGTNQAAEEGTACHEAVERLLNMETIEPGFVAENGIKLTVEHMTHVHEVVEWVRDQDFDRLFLEVRVPVGKALGLDDPNMAWGTSDIVGIKGCDITVADAKFGRVPVKAATEDPETGEIKHNSQAMCYLIGALEALSDKIPGDVGTMRNVILQPKSGNRLDDEAFVSFQDVYQFKRDARIAIEAALSDDPPFRPSEEACRFCPASGSCRAQVEAEFEVLVDEIEDDPAKLSNEELSTWLDKVDQIIATAKAIKLAALARLEVGQKIPGWVREQGSGRAKWIDEDEVVEEIKAAGLDLDTYAPRKPTTQTALKASSALGKKVVESLITRPPGEAKLVREKDATEPMDAEFEVLD